MDWLTIFIGLVLIYLIISTILVVFFVDGDLTLIYYDKFGQKLETLKGKVVWITGASTGIGAACAIEASKLGAKLVISARTESLLNQVKCKCLKKGGLKEDDVLVLPMDMTKYDTHKDKVDRVLEHFGGKIDIVIQNAGKSQRARWDHTDLSVDLDLFSLNVFGLINLTRLIIPHFKNQPDGGTFAVMSSPAGKAGVPFSGTYTASKHALHGYFEALRTEMAGIGINITMLCPGPTFSNLLQVAATEKQGELLKQNMNATDKRMTSQRAAHLSMVAISHKLEESWMSFFPVLPMMYACQYFPTISKKVVQFVGAKYIMKVRDSREDTVKIE